MQLRYTHYALPLLLATRAFAADSLPTNVPSANPRVAGMAAPNVLPPELFEARCGPGLQRSRESQRDGHFLRI